MLNSFRYWKPQWVFASIIISILGFPDSFFHIFDFWVYCPWRILCRQALLLALLHCGHWDPSALRNLCQHLSYTHILEIVNLLRQIAGCICVSRNFCGLVIALAVLGIIEASHSVAIPLIAITKLLALLNAHVTPSRQLGRRRITSPWPFILDDSILPIFVDRVQSSLPGFLTLRGDSFHGIGIWEVGITLMPSTILITTRTVTITPITFILINQLSKALWTIDHTRHSQLVIKQPLLPLLLLLDQSSAGHHLFLLHRIDHAHH